ncbi:MAG TPA: aminotransferase class I/II-fold pyridoxal phosphate-dependent enzyme, partial [Puia sp.]|nr:aminotransferase class I/II-fold pyridoxal phosphate-dependent enzyme [Puia sp.]
SNMDSGMFLPLQLAAATALGLPKSWYDSVNAVYKKRREKVFELLDLLCCDYSKQQAGMFVWAKVASLNSHLEELRAENPLGIGGALSDKVLYGSDVFITPGGIFGSAGDSYVRVSLCSTEEKLAESIIRVKQFLATKSDANV